MAAGIGRSWRDRSWARSSVRSGPSLWACSGLSGRTLRAIASRIAHLRVGSIGSEHPADHIRLVVRRLVVVLAILVLAVPRVTLAGEAGIRISSILEVEPRADQAPEQDDELVAMAAGPGKSLPSLEAASFVPFKPQWLVLHVSRTDSASRAEYFRVTSAQRRELDAFLIVEGRVVARSSGGYSRLLGGDAIDSPDFKVPLDAWIGTEATILLRTVATERLPYLPAFLEGKSAQKRSLIANAFLFFFIGCSLVFISFQLLIFLGLRERASRDYAIFVSLIVLVHVIRTGFLSWDFWPGEASVYAGDMLFALRLAVLISALRMIGSFLDLEEWNAPLHKWNRRLQLAAVAISLIAACFGHRMLQSSIAFWHIVAGSWGIFVAARAVAVRRPGAAFLLMAWSGLAITSIYMNLVITGLLAPSAVIPFVIPAGILWEMTLNGAGLVIRLEVLRQQRHEAHVRRVEVQEVARLVQIVCHDISNPLMVIRFALERLNQQVKTGEATATLAKSIHQARQGEQAILEIISDVRSLELLRSSRGALPVSAVNVIGLARDALAMFRDRAEEKGVQLVDQLPADEVIAYAAAGMLVRNVLANILSNALKFTPTGTRITLSLEREPGRIGLRITDCGAGISAETVAALERAEPLTSELGTAGERGTGFGLRITRDFVVAMGGMLRFHAPQPGAGTTVTTWLREG